MRLAQGNFTKLSIKGGVIGVYITWNCDLDWSFDDYCLPTYSFRILDTFGWNFRHAHYHEENRRTLVKAYGLKFLVVVDGRASKFDLKNTVIVLVTGLGLLGLSTMFCDFILLNYSTDRRRVRFMFIFQKNLDFFFDRNGALHVENLILLCWIFQSTNLTLLSLSFLCTYFYHIDYNTQNHCI